MYTKTYIKAFCELNIPSNDNSFRNLLKKFPYTRPATDQEIRLGIAQADEKVKQLERERLINEPFSAEERIFAKRKTWRSDD